MTTGFGTSGRAAVLLAAAVALLLGASTAALVLSGCARNDAGIAQQHDNSAESSGRVPALTESAPPGSGASSTETRPLAPVTTAVRPPTPPPTNQATATARSTATQVVSGRSGMERYPRPEDVPLAPMGEVTGFSPVTKSPGYRPGNDPEADAVRTGRRKAPVIDTPFTGGMGSPDELALYILEALRKKDSGALHEVRVTLPEFSQIMWPEFPQSRPYCNSDAEFAYSFMERTSYQGVSLGLSNWGGRDLRLEGVAYPGGRSVYTNFTLYNDVEMHVVDADGQTGVIRFARCFAERQGVWKVYTFKDKE